MTVLTQWRPYIVILMAISTISQFNLPLFTEVSQSGQACVSHGVSKPENIVRAPAQTLMECASACHWATNYVESCYYMSWDGSSCFLYRECIPEAAAGEPQTRIYQSKHLCETSDEPVGSAFLAISPSSKFEADTVHLYLSIPDSFKTQSYSFINATDDCCSWFRDNSMIKTCHIEVHQWWTLAVVGCAENFHLSMPISAIYNLVHNRNYVGWTIYENDGNQYLYSQLKATFTQQVKYKNGHVERYIEIWMPWYILLPNVVNIDVTIMVLTYKPSHAPSTTPTQGPTYFSYSNPPSKSPSFSPSHQPSLFPTINVNRTNAPSLAPSQLPTTTGYTYPPSSSPTTTPTVRPTVPGQIYRTFIPTVFPTTPPTGIDYTSPPSWSPTFVPTFHPIGPNETRNPSSNPSHSLPTISPTPKCYRPLEPCDDQYPCSANDVCDHALKCSGDFPSFSIESVVVYYKLKETHANSTDSRMKLRFLTNTPFPWKLIRDNKVNVRSSAKIDLLGWDIEQNCATQNCSNCDQKIMIDFIANKVCDIPKTYFLNLVGYNTVSAEMEEYEMPVDIVQSGVCGEVLTGLTVTAEAYLKTDDTFAVDLTSPILHVNDVVYIETSLISLANIESGTTFEYAIEIGDVTYVVIGNNVDDAFKIAIQFVDVNVENTLMHTSFLLDRDYFPVPITGLVVTLHSSIFVEYSGRRMLKSQTTQTISLPGMSDKANRCLTDLNVNILPFVCRGPFSDAGVPPGSYFPVQCDEAQGNQNLMYCDDYGWNEKKSMVSCDKENIEGFHIPEKVDSELVTGCPKERQCSSEPSIILTKAYSQLNSHYVHCCKSNEVCTNHNGRHQCVVDDMYTDQPGDTKLKNGESMLIYVGSIFGASCLIIFAYMYFKNRNDGSMESLELDQQRLLVQSFDSFE